MKTLLPLLVVFLSHVAGLRAQEAPQPAEVSTSQVRNAEVTTSTRPNGCILETWRYPKFKHDHWIQNVIVGEETLIRIQYSAGPKEHSFVVRSIPEYYVSQLDDDLDGKFEMLIIVSEKKQSIVDVLMRTDDGRLRHGTVEEFQARLRIAEGLRKTMEGVQKGIEDLKKEFER